MAANYKKHSGDRKEGRLLHSLSPFTKFIPFIMPTRNDATNLYEDSAEITEVDKFLHKARANGYKGIGMLHFMIAAYVRCVSMLPGMNRFVVGRRIYARDNIEVMLTVKREIALNAPETTVKVIFEPTDTVFDVYRKMNEKIDEIKLNDENNNTENVANALTKLPRFILRFALTILRIMDYYGWLPQSLLDASPFHASLVVSDLGSIRLNPVYHHIYNFGTVSMVIVFGSKRHAYELDKDGELHDRKYIDCKISVDERITDGHYCGQFFQAMKYIFQHPAILASPPSKVIEDVD